MHLREIACSNGCGRKNRSYYMNILKREYERYGRKVK